MRDPDNPPVKCVTCHWWDNATTMAADENDGQCRVLPPTADVKTREAMWPWTDQDDWRGAWKYDELGWGDGDA